MWMSPKRVSYATHAGFASASDLLIKLIGPTLRRSKREAQTSGVDTSRNCDQIAARS
jgi:hypothetical protein